MRELVICTKMRKEGPRVMLRIVCSMWVWTVATRIIILIPVSTGERNIVFMGYFRPIFRNDRYCQPCILILVTRNFIKKLT